MGVVHLDVEAAQAAAELGLPVREGSHTGHETAASSSDHHLVGQCMRRTVPQGTRTASAPTLFDNGVLRDPSRLARGSPVSESETRPAAQSSPG